PNFQDHLKFGPFPTTPVNQGGPTTLSRTISIGSGSLAKARRIFISVGARNSMDWAQPKPFGAIFSQPVQVQPELPPPPPPGSARGGAGGRRGKGGGGGGEHGAPAAGARGGGGGGGKKKKRKPGPAGGGGGGGPPL